MKSQALLLVLLGCTSCMNRSQPVVLHTLRPLVEAPKAPSRQAPGIEIMAVKIPPILQRSQIVSAEGPDRLSISDRHRWGNPLEQDIQRILLENLSALLGDEAVVLYPHGERIGAQQRLHIEIHRMDGQSGRLMTLQATWALSRLDGKTLVKHKVRLEQPLQGSDMDALVAAHSRILATLSQEIEAGVRASMMAGGPKKED
jgi:uncharacterized lipoprotein YmbA